MTQPVVSREPARPPRRDRSGLRFLRDLVVIVVVALLASFLIKTFLVRSFYIPSPSMENTLLGHPGHDDRILVDELVPGLVPLQRGDVIVFSDPGRWLAGEQPSVPAPTSPAGIVADQLLSLVGLSPQDANDHLVKRVIGLPGDRVACCTANGRTTVNGVALTEPYTKSPPSSDSSTWIRFDVVVPAGDVWVESDNRQDSADSRLHQETATKGGVPIKDIVGRAFVISWPVDRWRFLSSYPATFADVPAPKATTSG